MGRPGKEFSLFNAIAAIFHSLSVPCTMGNEPLGHVWSNPAFINSVLRCFVKRSVYYSDIDYR